MIPTTSLGTSLHRKVVRSPFRGTDICHWSRVNFTATDTMSREEEGEGEESNVPYEFDAYGIREEGIILRSVGRRGSEKKLSRWRGEEDDRVACSR